MRDEDRDVIHQHDHESLRYSLLDEMDTRLWTTLQDRFQPLFEERGGRRSGMETHSRDNRKSPHTQACKETVKQHLASKLERRTVLYMQREL